MSWFRHSPHRYEKNHLSHPRHCADHDHGERMDREGQTGSMRAIPGDSGNSDQRTIPRVATVDRKEQPRF